MNEETARAIAHLINFIPSCGALPESGILVRRGAPDEDVWWVDAGCDAHECGWRIENAKEGMEFIHDHYDLLREED